MPVFRSLDAYQKALDKRAKDILSLQREVTLNAAKAVNLDRSSRIFESGENANGGPIGQYSTDPIYINTTTPKNVKRKFQGGYRAYKIFIGRGGKVNLFLTGELQRDFISSLVYINGVWEERLKKPSSVNKANGAKDKYGNVVFQFSKEEDEGYKRLVGQVLTRKMQGR